MRPQPGRREDLEVPVEDKVAPRWLARAAALSWRALVVVGALYVAGQAFARVRLVVLAVVGALFASTLLAPPAHWLRRRGWPPLLATWAVFVGVFALVAAVAAALAPSIGNEFAALGPRLSQGVAEVKHWLVTGPFHLSQHQLDTFVSRAGQELRDNRSKLARSALSGVSVAVEGAGVLLLSLVLTFFFVKDGDHMARGILGLAHPAREEELRALGRRVWATLGGYVRGTALNGLVNGVLMAIGLTLIGVPLVVPIALLTFLGGFVPIVGAIVSGAVAALLALVSQGVVAGVLVVGLTVVIHHVEGYVVGPFVLGRAVHLHPVAVLLALTTGSILGGIVGVLLAVPVVAVVVSVAGYYWASPAGAPPSPVEGADVADAAGALAEEAAAGRRA
jgi:predicted PurR-regulated permease PerM